MKLRIAIVNDLVLAVEALRRVVLSEPEYEVAWVAADGAEAVRKCAADRPDLILMDLLMPEMNGVEATRLIMRHSPCTILVVTATVTGNAALVFEAMGHGALDAVCTPTLGPAGDVQGAAELLKKIATVRRLIRQDTVPLPLSSPAKPAADETYAPLIAIGASTGGPKALSQLLAQLPGGLAATVVIIQHVDRLFAAGLVEWLSGFTRLQVRLAAENDRPAPGCVFIAGTNDHLILGPDRRFHYTPEPSNYPYRPSVDAFFLSLQRCWPRRDAAALLTGMGRDGALGLLALKNAGWHTVAQDEKSSVIYGMPRAAAELGAATDVLPLEQIADALVAHSIRPRRRT